MGLFCYSGIHLENYILAVESDLNIRSFQSNHYLMNQLESVGISRISWNLNLILDW